MSDRLAVGILSAAHVHTDAYATHLADFEDVEFVGVADDDGERGRATAERHGVPYHSTDDLLDRLDAAVICSENARRPGWFEAAVEAGVHVLSEKPLAGDRDQAETITDVYEDGDVTAGLVMPLRFLPIAERAKSKYDAGAIGDVQFLTGTNRGNMPGGWFADPELSGGGAVMDHTVHILNLVRWITGREVREVYAASGTHFHDIPVEDVNVLSMTLDDDTPFTLDGSWSRPEELEIWGDATLEVLGTDGVIAIDPHEAMIRRVRDTGDEPGSQLLPYGLDENRRSLRDFLAAVREGRDPRSTIEGGRREMAVLEAAYESIETDDPVVVDY